MATYGTKKDVAWRIEEEEALEHLKVSTSNILVKKGQKPVI